MAAEVVNLDAAQLEAIGFAHVSTPASLSTLDVAHCLGEILRLEGVSVIQTLVPTKAEEVGKNRYSGLYGTTSFPLHTDMAHWHIPPRYFLLRCMHVAENVPTYFVHSREIFAPELELTLKRALFTPRRRLNGRLTCLRLREGQLYRWDPVFLTPVNALGIELRSRVLDRVATARKYAATFSSPGDCILVDNWKTLHGRAGVPPDAMHRRIERVYLEAVRL